jgi:hypothetical protein
MCLRKSSRSVNPLLARRTSCGIGGLRMFHRINKICVATATLLGSLALTPAATLNPGDTLPLSGTTVIASPNLAGNVVEDQLVPFSFAAYGGTVSGQVQVRVVSAVDNTCDFYWRVFNDANSSGLIGNFRVGEFYTSIYKADYRIDGLGDVAPEIIEFQFPHRVELVSPSPFRQEE